MTKTFSPIINSLTGADLSVTELIDPAKIKFYAASIADQMNKFRMTYSPQKRVIDLSAWINDIIVETSAQGSSLLEVHIIDPTWALLLRDKNGVSFIDVDDQGYIWPPVEVNFPSDVSDATWRLCQVRPSTSLTDANMVLTFEDKIASELREHAGPKQSFPNETRAEFIQSLVKDANRNPAYPGEVDIRFVPLLPKETFTVADLSMSQRVPKSATVPFARDHRKKPNKDPHQHQLSAKKITEVMKSVEGIDISMQDTWAAFAREADNHPFVPGPNSTTLPPPRIPGP